MRPNLHCETFFGSISAAFWSGHVPREGRSAGSFPDQRLVIEPKTSLLHN